MERISVTEASRHFDTLVDRVTRDGVTIELERDDRIVARLTPVVGRVSVADLNDVFARFPRLGEEAGPFAEDVSRIRRQLPRESDPRG